jgi:hypothetical protein
LEDEAEVRLTRRMPAESRTLKFVAYFTATATTESAEAASAPCDFVLRPAQPQRKLIMTRKRVIFCIFLVIGFVDAKIQKKSDMYE